MVPSPAGGYRFRDHKRARVLSQCERRLQHEPTRQNAGFMVVRLRKHLTAGQCRRVRRGLGDTNAEVASSRASADPDTIYNPLGPSLF